MSEASEEKLEATEEKQDPTFEESDEKMRAALKEAQETTADAEGVGQEPQKEEIEEPEYRTATEPPSTTAEAKARLMELGMPELREIAEQNGVKIPYLTRSKDAITDLLAAHFYGPTPEPGQVASSDEVISLVDQQESKQEDDKKKPKVDYEALYYGLLSMNAEVFAILDEQAGHAPTVRGFQILSDRIKALCPLPE